MIRSDLGLTAPSRQPTGDFLQITPWNMWGPTARTYHICTSVTQSYVGQESNVRPAFNEAEREFRTIHTLFRALSAFEGTSKTLELEAVQ